MKPEEAKLGMLVGLCRTLCKRAGWSDYTYNYFNSTCFPGKIVACDFEYQTINVVGPKSENWFNSLYLIIDE